MRTCVRAHAGASLWIFTMQMQDSVMTGTTRSQQDCPRQRLAEPQDVQTDEQLVSRTCEQRAVRRASSGGRDFQRGAPAQGGRSGSQEASDEACAEGRAWRGQAGQAVFRNCLKRKTMFKAYVIKRKRDNMFNNHGQPGSHASQVSRARCAPAWSRPRRRQPRAHRGLG